MARIMILLSISALGEAFSPNSGLAPRRATPMAAGKSKQSMKPKEGRGLGPFDELMYGKDGVGDYPPFGTLAHRNIPHRIEAQANTDAFLANPNDWAFAMIASERGKENTFGF